MTSAWAHRWLWGHGGCDVEAFIVYFLGLSSMYILMAIAFDRYIAISKPLLGTKITKTVAYISCSLCYALGFIWSILPAFGWNEFDLEGAGISCSVVWESEDPLYMSFIWTIFVFCFAVPLGVMLFSYWGVLSTLRGLNKNSVWDMNSRVAKRNLAIERKMLKTAVLIMASFFCCWMPYAIVSFVTAMAGSQIIHPLLATIPPAIAKCQGLIDPIVYVASNQQMRNALIEMLPCEGIKASLLKEEKEAAEDPESEESDVEGKTSQTKKKKKKKEEVTDNNKKSEMSKQRKSSGKKNQVHVLTVEPSADEGVSEISTMDVPVAANTVSTININHDNTQVSYKNSSNDEEKAEEEEEEGVEGSAYKQDEKAEKEDEGGAP